MFHIKQQFNFETIRSNINVTEMQHWLACSQRNGACAVGDEACDTADSSMSASVDCWQHEYSKCDSDLMSECV